MMQIKGRKLMRACEADEEPNATTKVRRKAMGPKMGYCSWH
jgi:hypothetical protein